MLLFVLTCCLPVLAKPDYILIVNKTNSSDIRQYSYSALNSSFASYKGDKASAGLFLDYYNKIKVGGGYKVYAIHDDASKIYADYASVNTSFAVIKGYNNDGTDTVKFSLMKYTSKTDPRFTNPVTATMVANVTNVIPNADPALAPTTSLIFTPDITPMLVAPLSNITVGGLSPVITGTPAAPILTFTVNSADRYSAGTATLSEAVTYNIKNASYDINGTAAVDENLMSTALQLLALKGNGSKSISGANLALNSPVTITVVGNSTGTTVYTINFVANP